MLKKTFRNFRFFFEIFRKNIFRNFFEGKIFFPSDFFEKYFFSEIFKKSKISKSFFNITFLIFNIFGRNFIFHGKVIKSDRLRTSRALGSTVRSLFVSISFFFTLLSRAIEGSGTHLAECSEQLFRMTLNPVSLELGPQVLQNQN